MMANMLRQRKLFVFQKFFAFAFQALAGGNLLYLAVFEILQREKCKEKVHGMLQLGCVILGFLLLMVLEISGWQKI